MMQMNVNGPHKLEICLLGGFSVAVDGETIPEERWRLRKVKNMVKLLALAPNHQVHREQLVDVLWPDLDFDAAMNMFYQTMHLARKALDPNGELGQQYLVSQKQIVSLGGGTSITIDVDQFREHAANARQASDLSAYQAAIESYPGDLLPEDLYEDWAQPLRDSLREEYLDLLAGYSDMLEERRDYAAAIEVLRKLIGIDSSREAAHSRLMHLYAVIRAAAAGTAPVSGLERSVVQRVGYRARATNDRTL
jgi:DNA-binding SARP family transcriptional activator